MKSCFNCEHSGVLLESAKRICRAEPPKVQVLATPTHNGLQLHTVTAWPEVKDSDRCGRWASGDA